MEKTLVILIGDSRGGEKTWHTMYDHLLKPFNADLALCFGYKENKTESLYERAKYIWETPEYKEWGDYYVQNFGKDGVWKKVFDMGKEIGFSGLYGSRGSGAIALAFRDWILKNKKEVLLSYDRIVVSRSDHFYVADHPLVDTNHFWIPVGEGYGGITDRHHVFPSCDVDLVLGVVKNYINTEKIIEDFEKDNRHLNLEQVYMKYFTNNDYFDKVKEFKRVQFTVKTETDSTRWWGGMGNRVIAHPELLLKYGHEYDLCMTGHFGGTHNVDQYGNRLV